MSSAVLPLSNDEQLAHRLGFVQNAFGAILGPQDCWLTLRGLKNTEGADGGEPEKCGKDCRLAGQQPQVTRVYYPGLASHPGYAIHAGSGIRSRGSAVIRT